jgi:hypothetical protein
MMICLMSHHEHNEGDWHMMMRMSLRELSLRYHHPRKIQPRALHGMGKERRNDV